ncbi:MAG: transglutaminase family protein [Promethearchaeota archaeon]
MSVIGEDLSGKKIDKKRVLGIVIIAILLISMFAFSTVLLNLLFGTQRYDFDDSVSDKDEVNEPPLTPYFPWEDLNFSDIPPEDLDDLLDMLSDLLDGNSDDLDLSQFSEGLMALLASAAAEMEVFRVYGYSNFNEMDEKLWKYECYDQYTGTDWLTSVPMQVDDFYTFNNYSSQYWFLDLLKIKMLLSPNASERNSIAIPSLFPIPFIIKESFDALNNLSVSTLTDTTLYKNLFNVSKADLYFSSNDAVNMTYNLFGLDLRSNDEINSLADTVTNPTPEYLDLLTMYTQIPPNLQTYLTNNLNFKYHYDILNNTIINQNDNAFVIANKIRNYLQTNFYLNYTPSPDPGRDAVDWFCEQQQGLWPDFATAFSIFSRAFGVASRFVSGFNSRWIESFTDYNENPPFGEETFAIKYKNLYNWAEIFVPFNIFGDGEWVQMDILFDSYGTGGSPITGDTFNITVTSDKLFYNRTDEMKLTATLSSLTASVENRTITFTDITSNQILGVNDTDVSGITKISVQLNDSYVVGPHIIEARYDFFNFNYTVTVILGDIAIDLTNVNPTEVNRSDPIPDETYVQGYVYDPINGKRVKDAEVNFVLLQKVTSIEEPFAFTPPSQITGNNGEFDTTLTINPIVPSGQYEIRVDFNGTWILYGIPFPVGFITNSSNRMGLNITKALSVWFYIDNTPADNPYAPSVSRGSTLDLTAKVMLENFGPKPDKEVFFYDYSRGGIKIGSAFSDENGTAFITYDVLDYCISGPNLLFARLGIQENYSYFIVDESPTIHITSGPTPQVINRTGGGNTNTKFNIIGNITDAINSSRPLRYSEVTLRLISDGYDNSSYLVPSESYPYQTLQNGTFDLTFEVDPSTPTGNYTLRMDFYGTIDLTSYPYPYIFNLVSLSSSIVLVDELKVETPAILYFDFWINGYPSYDINNPIINRYDALNLTVLIQYGSTPIPNGEWVDFYDVTQGTPIDSVQTISGYANASYPIGLNSLAGPHLIYAKWKNNYHYSYFILDAPIIIALDVCPQPPEIFRSGTINRNFIIHGFLNDSDNGNPIKFGEITVHLFDGPTDVSYLLNLVSGSLVLDETGEFDLTYQVSESTPARNYTLEVWFNGWFDYLGSSYPYYFNLDFITNFTSNVACVYDLKVMDPDDINIYLFVDGTPTLSFYDDIHLPKRYNPGEQINLTVIIEQGGSPGNGTVILTDVYTSIVIGSYTYGSADYGYHEFINTTTNWHVGLHKIKVEWDATLTSNTTYVIINGTVNIFGSIDKNSVIRNLDSFIVDGTVLESGEGLRGLVLEITLLNSTYSDVTSYYLIGSQTDITDNVGYYQFFNFIDISCPQGDYYIRIEFNGGIQEAGISLSDYMVHNSSSDISIKIIAGTYIIGFYDTLYDKEDWYFNDELWVYGNLYWDNGTPIENMYINATVRDGNGNILETALSFQTDAFGFFNVTFTVGAWEDDTVVYVYFYPEDIINFGPDGTYVQIIEQQVFRPP